MKPFGRTTVLLAAAVVSSCGGAESFGPVVPLTISSAPDLRAIVTKVTFESANGPGFGLYEQYDVWLAVAPSETTNAGLIVPKSGPTFVRTSDGAIHAGAGDMIRVGDVLEIWRTQVSVFGAVQGPPGAPTYEARQVVIER